MRRCVLLLCEHDPCAELPTNAVREGAEFLTRQIILEIARVEMIRHIENLQPYFRTVLLPPSWETNTFHHLQVERSECWKAPGAIAWTDKVSVLVNDRKGKSGADLQDRRQPDSMLDMEAAPEKKTVRDVKRQ